MERKLVNLEQFKCKECTLNHEKTAAGPYYFSCQFYHSKIDKRRNPIKTDEGGNISFLYSNVYLEDYYSPLYCASYLEYLYHPLNYKKIKCIQERENDSECIDHTREIKDKISLIVDNKFKCNYEYCPYLHVR
jgi:hypothetical protein